MDENFLSIKKVKDIAQELNVTEETLCREFKKQCCVSCKNLLLFYKIRYAITLFSKPELNISEIAYKSGFSNPKRFSETFHRLTDLTPSDYKKRLFCQTKEEILQQIWQKIKKTEEMSKKRK